MTITLHWWLVPLALVLLAAWLQFHALRRTSYDSAMLSLLAIADVTCAACIVVTHYLTQRYP